MTESPKSFDKEDLRLQMILASRRRSDDSANYLRVLLFALASGMAYFVANYKPDAATETGILFLRFCAFFSLAVAIAVIVKSWFLQKRKSLDRYRILKDGGWEQFEARERMIAETPHERNMDWDALACSLIVLAAILIAPMVFR